MSKSASTRPSHKELAEAHYQVRQFLRVGEETARNLGLEPQQYWLLVALAGLADDAKPTVTALAERLALRHHSTSELVDRAASNGLVARRECLEDKREILIELTSHGGALLGKISHSVETASVLALQAALQALCSRD